MSPSDAQAPRLQVLVHLVHQTALVMLLVRLPGHHGGTEIPRVVACGNEDQNEEDNGGEDDAVLDEPGREAPALGAGAVHEARHRTVTSNTNEVEPGVREGPSA
jgi:hypothetical protein